MEKTAENPGVSGIEKLEELFSRRFPDVERKGNLREVDRELIRSGRLTESELLAMYNQAFQVPEVNEEEVDIPDLPEYAPLEFFNSNTCLPLEWEKDTVTLLLPDPYDLEGMIFLIRKTWDCAVSPRFVKRAFLERILTKMQNAESGEDQIIDQEDENTLRSMAGEAKIVRLVNDIFTQAIELGASDIHVEPGETSLSVRCRVDGVLTEIMNCPLSQFPAIASRIKLIGGLNIAESRVPQDGRTNVQIGRTELDMRISTIPILTGESIVLRLLNQEAVSFDLRTLGMSEEILKKFNKLIGIPHGMILVVGPTGSGKTTTLYSVINQLNDSKKKIITVEDPVEYKTPGLCQMQVNHKIGVTFATGLRSIVRQDPDVILVGEIRDQETADIAINARPCDPL